MDSILLVAFALGVRHGTDPDHLTAIDGLSRIRPRATNGLFFALGHGLVVTALAVGVGQVVAGGGAGLGAGGLFWGGRGTLCLFYTTDPSAERATVLFCGVEATH